MKNKNSKPAGIGVMVLSILLLAACCKNDETNKEDSVVVMTATGDVNSRLNEFRQLLGDQLNTTPNAVGGRREINWDAVPDGLLNQSLPFDFLNPTHAQAPVPNQRGLVYSTAGNFQVSKTNFLEVNPDAANQFSNFSGNKSFANISSSLWDVEFQVAGKTIPANVKGFGIVLSDVDLPNSTSLEFFNKEKSLGKFFVPAKAGSNFSFLGVYFKNEQVSRIRVSHDGHLDNHQKDISDNGPSDLVTMDNFLYAEPVKATD